MEYPTELKSKHKQRYEISHFESKIGKKKNTNIGEAGTWLSTQQHFSLLTELWICWVIQTPLTGFIFLDLSPTLSQ